MRSRRWRATTGAMSGVLVAATVLASGQANANRKGNQSGSDSSGRKARNVIFFVGDGMGVSTISAIGVFSVGVAGQLVLDQFPYTALSRTYSSDSITPDSAPTMTAMVSGVNTNQSVIGLDDSTEPSDFNHEGDGQAPRTILELAKARGMKVGVVSTAQITHATPAATYAHINQRNNESDIALQALPSDVTYNSRLGNGIDVLMGGGRRFFVPSNATDEEGGTGGRTDGRDLRNEFTAAGYTYVWNKAGFDALSPKTMPVLALFERGHMEYEFDRPTDQGGEPSIVDMTVKAIELLQGGSRRGKDGFFLMVEGGRIDHAHHEGNAYGALTDAEALDRAIGAAAQMVDLRETLIIVSADHSHVFNVSAYPLRPLQELPYQVKSWEPRYAHAGSHGNGILDVVDDLDQSNGHVSATGEANGVPYTVLGYHNGPGYRGTARVDPRTDGNPGRGGLIPSGPWHQAYFPEAAVPLGSETHSGEDVAIYAIGAAADAVRGTVKNTYIFHVIKRALGID